MDKDELRVALLEKINNLLAKTFLVRGEDRRYLTMTRDYVVTMTPEELTRLHTFYSPPSTGEQIDEQSQNREQCQGCMQPWKLHSVTTSGGIACPPLSN